MFEGREYTTEQSIGGNASQGFNGFTDDTHSIAQRYIGFVGVTYNQ